MGQTNLPKAPRDDYEEKSASAWRDREVLGLAEPSAKPLVPIDRSRAWATRRECGALPTLDFLQPFEKLRLESVFSPACDRPSTWLLKATFNTTEKPQDASRQPFWVSPRWEGASLET